LKERDEEEQELLENEAETCVWQIKNEFLIKSREGLGKVKA